MVQIAPSLRKGQGPRGLQPLQRPTGLPPVANWRRGVDDLRASLASSLLLFISSILRSGRRACFISALHFECYGTPCRTPYGTVPRAPDSISAHGPDPVHQILNATSMFDAGSPGPWSPYTRNLGVDRQSINTSHSPRKSDMSGVQTKPLCSHSVRVTCHP